MAMFLLFFYPFKLPLNEELGAARYVVEPIFMISPFCAMWMAYRAIRYEQKPLHYVLLACFVPFAFVWYYVERVRLTGGSRAGSERLARHQSARRAPQVTPENNLGSNVLGRFRGGKMKTLLWGLFFVVTIGVLLLGYQEVWRPGPAAIIGIVILYSLHPFGAFWMAYKCLRYEGKPFPLALFALLIPFSFLWYYVERVRSGKHLTRESLAVGAPNQ